jgi:hypothetical protein
MHISWFIPTTGDGRYLGSSHQSRVTDYPYLRQIAQAVDDLGFYAVLLPTGNSCEDAWVVASTLMPSTRQLKFLVAIRPGIMTPTVAARMTATCGRLDFQGLSAGGTHSCAIPRRGIQHVQSNKLFQPGFDRFLRNERTDHGGEFAACLPIRIEAPLLGSTREPGRVRDIVIAMFFSIV